MNKIHMNKFLTYFGSEDDAICSPTNFSAVGRNGGYGCNRGIDSSTFGRGSDSSVSRRSANIVTDQLALS